MASTSSKEAQLASMSSGEAQMASATRVDAVLHHLHLLYQDLDGRDWHQIGSSFELSKSFRALPLKLQCLRTFLVCATKWRNKNNDIYLESDDNEKVITLHSFLSNIEDVVNIYGAKIHSLCLRRETESVHLQEATFSALRPLVIDFHGIINSFKHQIIKAYIDLSRCSSSQSSNSCMRDLYELVDFIDLVVHNLMKIIQLEFFRSNEHLLAQVEALENKLTFLMNFVLFAKFQGINNCQLGDLLVHTEVVALNAARLSYLCCDAWFQDDEVWDSPKTCCLISELVQMIMPVDSRIRETYISVLKASKSSSSTYAAGMDTPIISNFNVSLINCLWEQLWCNSSFADTVKDQIKLLYKGLRFLRSILREPFKTDKVNEDIRAVIAEAGVILFSLSRNQVQNGSDIDSLELTRMLVGTNRDIRLIGAQNINSEALVSLPSDDSIKQQAQSKILTLTPSKVKMPRIHQVVVDLHDEVQTVKDRLMSGSNQLEIVQIVGMPGLGKTTLAKSIFDDPSIKYHFHSSLWCCVSQSYNKRNVLLQILGNDATYSNIDVNDLLLKLYQSLKKKKYLVVLDDVWDIDLWNDLKTAFPNDHNGSRILITSRFSNVASQVGKSHNLRQLTHTESWELLQKKVFGKEDCPEALQRPGMEIAKNCKGLPLTVVIIAGILATVEHDAWVEVAESLTSTMVCETDQHCKNTLELSYIHLPSHLKPCLLYFGAFREDQGIRARELTWLWMAEGFVQPTKSKRLEDVAEEYLMDLINRNLVMVSKQRTMGGAKTCCIHDLIHEFCKAKAKEENFLQVLQGYDELSVFNVPSNLERLSIYSSPEELKMSRLFCPHARSILLFDHHTTEFQTIANISFNFCLYQHLRVLKIVEIRPLPRNFLSEIGLLLQLRFLAVMLCCMDSVPPSIGNLTNLETLAFFCFSSDFLLPETIWNLKKLRHLHIKGYFNACRLPTENPESTSSLDRLDTLSCLGVSLDRLEDIVKRIPNVRRLEVELTGNPFNYCTTTLTMDSLSRLERLELKASLEWQKSDWKCYIEYCFPMTLRELSLVELHNAWSKISVIEDLPNLEVLKLLIDSFEGKRWEMKAGGFPKLRFLKLEFVDVVEWTDDNAYDSDHFFPCLEKLVLEGLRLEKVPSCLHCIPTLEMIQVKDSDETVNSLVREIMKEQEEFGNENLKILVVRETRASTL